MTNHLQTFPVNGYVESPFDANDFPYHQHAPVFKNEQLPNEYVVPGIITVDNQGSVNSCVANSLGLVKDAQEKKELSRNVRFSRQFIYSNRGAYDHKGQGMVPRQALRQLLRSGVPAETHWPGLVEIGRETWPADKETLFDMARPFKIESYLRLEPLFVPVVKSALITLGAALYCVRLDSNFVPDGNGNIPMPNGTLWGYHAMSLVGWKLNYWLVQNSWGEAWGQKGRCWIPWSYPVMELWSATDDTTFKKTRKVRIVDGDARVWIDGVPRAVDRAPRLVDDRFEAPIRHIAEAFDARIDWGHTPNDAWENAGKVWAEFEIDLPGPSDELLKKLLG